LIDTRGTERNNLHHKGKILGNFQRELKDEKQGILTAEKDKDVLEKKDRPTKRIFKDFAHSQHTRVNNQLSH
jgi:hypothetical protein